LKRQLREKKEERRTKKKENIMTKTVGRKKGMFPV